MSDIKEIINQGLKFYNKLREDENGDIDHGNIAIKYSMMPILLIMLTMILLIIYVCIYLFI